MAILDSNGISLLTPPNPAYQLSGNSCRWNVAGDCLACVSQHNSATNEGLAFIWKYNKLNSTFTLEKSFLVPDFDHLGGACFSPSGRFLYISCFTSLWTTTRLWRYDIYQPDSITTINSKINLLSSNYPHIYKSAVTRLQLAADQKIYCTVLSEGFFLANNPYPITLGVINHPDSTYAGNFNANAVNNLGKKPIEFPNFVLKWIARPPFSLRHACQDSVVFDLTYKNIVDSVYWDFGDPASGALNFSNLLSPVHHYTGYGRYYVQVVTCWQGECDTLADTVRVEPVPTVTLPNDTLLCPGASLTINIGQGFAANYLWSTGSTDSIVTLNQSGTYMATSYTACGASTDTITIKVIAPPAQQLRDTTLCDNYRVALHIVADSATYLWSTGDTTATLYPTASGQYSVQVQNPCGSITDQAEVTYKRCLCNVYVPTAFTPDGDGLNDLFGPVADCPDFRFALYIYNRWGGQVAVLTESNPEWDGTYQGEPVPMGVYTYRFEYKGTEYNLTKQEWLNGVVSVLR
jgi:gliding motility-associated-like protein